jgi:hypothetical protein
MDCRSHFCYFPLQAPQAWHAKQEAEVEAWAAVTAQQEAEIAEQEAWAAVQAQQDADGAEEHWATRQGQQEEEDVQVIEDEEEDEVRAEDDHHHVVEDPMPKRTCADELLQGGQTTFQSSTKVGAYVLHARMRGHRQINARSWKNSLARHWSEACATRCTRPSLRQGPTKTYQI